MGEGQEAFIPQQPQVGFQRWTVLGSCSSLVTGLSPPQLHGGPALVLWVVTDD